LTPAAFDWRGSMRRNDPQRMVASLYARTAAPALATAALSGDRSVAVCIVGAGFTGLSAALHLAEAGRQAIVIDRNEPGWGASGRNGGQVNPGLKHDPDEIERDFGPALGRRMIALAGGAPAFVFGLIARLKLDCEALCRGTIRAAVSARQLGLVRDAVEQWARRGAPVEFLDRDTARDMIGSDYYAGALLDHRGGSLNPLAYARGLADAALRAGATIVSATPARALHRQAGRWTVETPSGNIFCDHLIIATNGYTDRLWPQLSRTIVPVYSAIAATEPLEPRLSDAILASRPVVYEQTSFHAYYRIDAFGHFLMGAGSPLRDTGDPLDYAHLQNHAVRLFPALTGVSWKFFWNGQIAITADRYPHIHEPAEGVHIGLGYNGRGVAMATLMGRLLAERVCRSDTQAFALPITPIRPIPFHRFWKTGVQVRRVYDRLREQLDR
jgi:glycine/D-amino acid oxidase-like deaminating enzyme